MKKKKEETKKSKRSAAERKKIPRTTPRRATRRRKKLKEMGRKRRSPSALQGVARARLQQREIRGKVLSFCRIRRAVLSRDGLWGGGDPRRPPRHTQRGALCAADAPQLPRTSRASSGAKASEIGEHGGTGSVFTLTMTAE